MWEDRKRPHQEKRATAVENDTPQKKSFFCATIDIFELVAQILDVVEAFRPMDHAPLAAHFDGAAKNPPWPG